MKQKQYKIILNEDLIFTLPPLKKYNSSERNIVVNVYTKNPP